MASAQVMSTCQGDDLLIVESHAVEDESQVVCALCTVGQPTTGRYLTVVYEIGAASLPGMSGPPSSLIATTPARVRRSE
ncbi:hypothetical protein N7470_007149 [Penicillium chermesinum]|nr:hypothetical protein N7470_007149 [Penicillium chermesinum]